jgi:DNA-binding winged helix-turn-helix (wHTH) protein
MAFGDFLFDPLSRELRRFGTLLKVDRKQLQLLECLLLAGGDLQSRQDLIDRVWDGRPLAESAVSVTVAKLRSVLGQNSGGTEYIENRYGRGYRFLEPITEVDRVLAAGADRPPASFSTPFVGRAESLERLRAMLARARQGEGRLSILLGEPGIGKTRLAEVVEQSARVEKMRVAWGRFHPAGGAPPLWPFAQVLRELGATDLADRITAAASERMPTAAERRDGFSESAMTTSHQTIEEIAGALVQISRREPLLILLDDLHWADRR